MKRPPLPKILSLSVGFVIAGLSFQPARAVDGTWELTTGGSWGLNTNWVADVVPGGVGSTVTFPGINTANPATVTLDGERTVGILNLTGANTATSGTVNWNITAGTPGTSTLTFDNDASNAQLNAVNRINPGIAANVIVNSNLDVNKSGVDATTLQLSGTITGTGRTINLNGTGTTQTVSVNNAGVATSFVNGTWVVNNVVFNMNAGFKGDATTKVTLGTGAGTSILQTNGTHAVTNTITVAAGGTNTLQSITSGQTLNTGSVVLNGDLTAIANAGTTFNLAGAAGATITGAGGIIVSGPANLNIAGAASHQGVNTVSGANLTVTAAGSLNGSSTAVSATRTFTLAATADYAFDIGANGVNDAITGAGIVTLNGDFVFNLAGANTTVGNTWQIVDNANLTETFSDTFTVSNLGATGGEAGETVWSFTNAGTQYQFSEATGQLSVVPEPSTFAMLLGGLGTLLSVQRSRRRNSQADVSRN